MSIFFIDIEGVIIYIEDITIIGAGTFEEHMVVVDEVLRCLEETKLQVNPLKSFLGAGRGWILRLPGNHRRYLPTVGKNTRYFGYC